MACQNYRDAAALATELEAVCRADVKEAAASWAAASMAFGTVEAGRRIVKTMVFGRGLPSGDLAVGAATAAPMAVMQLAGAGGTQYTSATATRVKFFSGFIPTAGPIIESAEAMHSCKEAGRQRARVDAWR